RVLALTIDPSRRLAEALGVDRNTPEPVRLSPEREREAGIAEGGSLSAWMLDTRLVSDSTVRRLTKTPEEAERLMRNPIYEQVTRMIAGMQEYTAMEALRQFVESGRYDLVVLDTPPSRNALNFLEAPTRLAQFLDGRIFQLFVPKEGGFLRSAAGKIVDKVLAAVFGPDLATDLSGFFGSFAAIFGLLGGNATRMRDRLRKPDTTFLLVTSPAGHALDDALFFERRIRDLDLPFGGFVLNRSRAAATDLAEPGDALLPPNATAAHRSALEKLRGLAADERRAIETHRAVLAPLAELGDGIDDVAGLARLAAWLERSG
ncbi:MAG TPA: ArsA-related P-loop ATPase, partial [Planctomycetota bacterium]|nr:ArsA-related P-loop ATPase [Planctomycetota bacterium]